MMKKWGCIAAAALLTIGIGAAYAGGAGEGLRKYFEPEIMIETPLMQEETMRRQEMIQERFLQDENVSSLDKYEQMCLALDAVTENTAEYNDVLYNYEYLKEAYHLTQDQLDYLADLIIKGYRPMVVMDICYFWLDTNEDISVIEEIYALKELYHNNAWIENAFNRVTEDRCGVLDEDDIEAYFQKGIGVKEIQAANRLCRRGVYTIQEILDMRLSGKCFAEIASLIHGISQNDLPDAIRGNVMQHSVQSAAQDGEKIGIEEELIAPEMVLCAETLSQIEEVPVIDFYREALTGVSLKDELEEKNAAFEEMIDEKLFREGRYKDVTADEMEAYVYGEEAEENE